MKRYFITGLLIWVPLGITLWVLDLLIGSMDQTLTVLPAAWQPHAWLGMRIPGLGVILTLLVIVLTGVFATNFFGQKLILVGLFDLHVAHAQAQHGDEGRLCPAQQQRAARDRAHAGFAVFRRPSHIRLP